MSERLENELWVSWSEYHHAIERLALIIADSGWKFDQVLCLARGGMRPGDILSRLFKAPLAVLSTSSYRTGDSRQRGDLRISGSISMTTDSLAGRILLVDDMVDSGVTLDAVLQHLGTPCTAVTEVRTAVIWSKACSCIKPDFFVEYLETNPWIHQPFEEYDTLSLQQIRMRV
jgi:hypoxanthine phosphoribosyltransferase